MNQNWKLTDENGNVEEFFDIRRKVGNQIIRSYLLKEIFRQERIERTKISLRGPKNEFKDFAKYLILQFTYNEQTCRLLVETGVYENLRIVGTDAKLIRDSSPDQIIEMFTNALEHPNDFAAKIMINEDSKIGIEQ